MYQIYNVPSTTPVLKIQFLLEDYLTHFENEIKKNVGEMDYKTNVKGQMTGFQHFLKDKKFNDFLKIFCDKLNYTKQINDCLKLKNFNSIQVVDAWGNKLNSGEVVKPHHHIGSVDYSSVLYFSNTYLFVEKKKIKVSRGDVLTFFCTAEHWTEEANEERLSLAFNWRNTSKTSWDKK